MTKLIFVNTTFIWRGRHDIVMHMTFLNSI